MENRERTSETTDLPPLAVSALLEGRKIEAIKIVRKELGVDLKEAADAVEAYIQRDPVIQETLKSAGRSSSAGWILLVIVLATLAWYFFTNQGA